MKELQHEFDKTIENLYTGDISAMVSPLVYKLAQMKWRTEQDEWRKAVSFSRSHPIFELLYQDPFSRRAFEKPRGYPGDAELLDIIYNSSYHPFVSDVTPFGERMFPFIINRKMPSAVRERRSILAAQIDSVCKEIENPHILSIACGHLRETQHSESFLAGRTGKFVGLDQDGESLAEVERELSSFGVTTVNASIKSIFKKKVDLGKFDFIYAAGLYDYLPDGFAHLFTRRLFEMLKPNGKLLVANFLKGIEDAGYVEIFMDWSLIYRDSSEVENLSSEIPKDQIASTNIFNDSTDNIAYLEIRKV